MQLIMSRRFDILRDLLNYKLAAIMIDDRHILGNSIILFKASSD